jgi:hypothetical protein
VSEKSRFLGLDMDISRKTRDRTFLAVATLFLIIIILFIFVKVNQPAITGFAGQENNATSENVLFENLDSTSNPPPNLPPMPEIEEPEVVPRDRGLGKGFVSGGGSGSSAGNSGQISPGQAKKLNQTNSTNQTLPGNSTLVNYNKKLSKMPFGFDMISYGQLKKEGDEFRGKVRFNLEKSSRKISAFNITFNESDVDISDIIGDSDFNTGKAFMHHDSGLLEDIDLYVPI